MFSPYDLKRLESYSKNLIDFHAIIDLVPVLARLYFLGTLSDELAFSAGQSCILLGIGLQAKSIDDVAVRLYGLFVVVLSITCVSVISASNRTKFLLCLIRSFASFRSYSRRSKKRLLRGRCRSLTLRTCRR